MPLPKAEEIRLWPDPQAPPGSIRKGGAILILRLSPPLLDALRARTDEPTVGNIALQALYEWAGVSEETEAVDEPPPK